MGKSNHTTLKKGDNLPPRGKSNKTRILDAIRSESVKSLLRLNGEPSRDQAEEAFFAFVARRALNLDDKDSSQLLKVLADKGWGNAKPVMDTVEFEFPADGTPSQRAFAVVEAISSGGLSPDLGAMIVGIIKDAIVIEESTELKARIEGLEKTLGLSNG